MEYQKLMMRNETVESFVFGEPSTIETVTICNQNNRDIGLAVMKEFPHVALIRVRKQHPKRTNMLSETRCVGTLISERHVITSVFCVFLEQNQEITVHLGVFNDDSIDENSKTYKVEDFETKYGVTILKLNIVKVEFSEHIMPICLHPDKSTKSSFLLAGWIGDWRDCDPKLKKWHIDNQLVKFDKWNLQVDESMIINYRQVRFTT